ncbi:MAG: radical SAM protein [Proteobacteria bacterium]|nr:radical SAM protein [Pseudomonadota bacterium]
MGFFEGGISRLAVSAVTKDAPVYVQFYVTARCNLRCEQCNVIYANADQQEATTEQCFRIAENLAKIGTSVALLTGGEPFVRKDIVEIAKAFIDHGVHPRLQTNGIAKRSQLEEMARIGAHDISISLDSVVPTVQDTINGGFDKSWLRAIKTMSAVNELFPEDSFAAIGCVLSPRNIDHIHGVIEFATQIGWHVSLVPAHTTPATDPRSFRTYDPALQFSEKDHPRVYAVLEKVKAMRGQGYNVYDSDEYLDDIYRFVTGQPVQWRRRNNGVCDAPNLYFAIQPNGDMAVCCDFRFSESYPVYADDFPQLYRDRKMRAEALNVARACSGCMYGSFPEITISSRFLNPMFQRARLFLLNSGGSRTLKRLTPDQMVEAARDIASKHQLI